MKKIIAALLSFILLFGSIAFADDAIDGEWIVSDVTGSGGNEVLQGFRDCQDWYTMTVNFSNGILHTVAKPRYDNNAFEADAEYVIDGNKIWINGHPGSLKPETGKLVITDWRVQMTLTRPQAGTAGSAASAKQSGQYTVADLDGTWKLSSIYGKDISSESAFLTAGLQILDLIGSNLQLKCENGKMTLTFRYTRKGDQKTLSFAVAYGIRNNKLVLDLSSVPVVMILGLIAQAVNSKVDLSSANLKVETFDIDLSGNDLLIGCAGCNMAFTRQ